MAADAEEGAGRKSPRHFDKGTYFAAGWAWHDLGFSFGTELGEGNLRFGNLPIAIWRCGCKGKLCYRRWVFAGEMDR